MALISLKDATLALGGLALLDRVCFQIEKGEKVCLIGRNGTGKSTLLKVLHGMLTLDQGEVSRSSGVRTAFLPQEVPPALEGTVFAVVLSGLQRPAGRRDRDPDWVRGLGQVGAADAGLGGSAAVQAGLDSEVGWPARNRVEAILDQLHLPRDHAFETLSSGLKRRALLARALVVEPDLLLLDEPTNHLDLDAIRRLENFLVRYSGTLLFVSHDRMLIRKTATRMVELDRGRLLDWACDFETFLDRREAFHEMEESRNQVLDLKLAAEEAWVRKGVKARRTRNEGRVRALEQLRALRQSRRERPGDVRLRAQPADRSGRLVVAATELCHGFGDLQIIDHFSTTVLRGDKVGLIGPNGVGKTTLLRILVGELTPQRGTVRHGTHLEVAYFDQLRAQLDESLSLQDNVAEGNDTVTINGKPRHVIGYLKDFLFTPEQARAPISRLSGGERNRLALARLFARPANLLVLDEPTNDLDMETLELLEQLLMDYPGTVLLVSHDRAFLNNVVTSTLVFEGAGRIREYVGGYDDWLRQREPPAPLHPGPRRKPLKPARPAASNGNRRRLNPLERRELDSLPERIEALEAEQAGLYDRMAAPDFYRQSGAEIRHANERLQALAGELEDAYRRWQHLESIESAQQHQV